MKKALYSLQREHKHSLATCTPTLRDLYAIMVVTIQKRCTNWIAVNKILGRRVTDEHAATYLSLLVSLDAIETAEHWQLSHLPEKRIVQLLKDLSLELCKHGDVSWDSEYGELCLSYMNNRKLSSLGWVELGQFEELMNLLTRGQRVEYPKDYTDLGADDVLEMILKDKDYRERNAEMESLIRDLMSEACSS